MDELTLGVLGRSRKENEHRLPLHPRHLSRIPEDLRARIYLESGYGERFGAPDDELRRLVAGIRTREELIDECDVILQPKPLLDDVAELRDGQVLWGWPHCVQDETSPSSPSTRAHPHRLRGDEPLDHGRLVQPSRVPQEQRAGGLLLGAPRDADLRVHRDYGPRLRAVVIGFGATARGAVTALQALGVNDVDVLTHRQVAAVASPIHSARILHFDGDDTTDQVSHAVTPDGPCRSPSSSASTTSSSTACSRTPNARSCSSRTRTSHLSPGTMVVDVSCDEGMGFSWARPTTFDDPTFVVGRTCSTTPSTTARPTCGTPRPGRSARRCCPSSGRSSTDQRAWHANRTIRRAIEVRAGVVQNPGILTFQTPRRAVPARA